MRQDPLSRLTAGAATAFAIAAVAVYPLYIDKFSNLGVTKFAGVFVLFLLFGIAIGACAAIGAPVPEGRYFAPRRDATLWGIGAVTLTALVSTLLSLEPISSFWGLGSYYGGMSMVLFTGIGYFCLRSYAARADFDLLTACVGGTVIVVTLLYLLNILNIDLIGAYADTAVVERAQFFSTLGQKDFNAGYLSIALPITFYCFLAADGRKPAALRAIPAVVGTLALAIVDSEGLLLGIAVALAVLACHRDFNTRRLRRIAFLGATFFAWDLLMYVLRRTVYTQGGTPMLAKFGEPQRAVPGMLICAGIWLALWAVRRGKTELPLYRGARVLVLAGGVGAAALVLLVNLAPGFPALGTLDNFLLFNDDWGTYRGTAWRIAWGAWADAPLWRQLLGYGPGMMHTAVAQWAGSAMTARMNTFYAAHNEYLELLLTGGVAGLAAWVAFAAAHLRRGFRDWSRPAVAPVLLALCSYLAQAVVSIRVSMIFPEVMLLFALLAAHTAPEQPAPVPMFAPAGRGALRTLPKEKTASYRVKVIAAAVAAMVIAAPVSHLALWFLF